MCRLSQLYQVEFLQISPREATLKLFHFEEEVARFFQETGCALREESKQKLENTLRQIIRQED